MKDSVALVALALTLATSSTAAAKGLHVEYRSTPGGEVSLPAGACEGASEGMTSELGPLLGATPGRPEQLRAVYQAHGERVQVSARSEDGGRTWTRTVIADATQCTGGPEERNFTYNPLFDVGAGGAAWFGQSWTNSPAEDFDMWSYGVALHESAAPGSWKPGVTPPPADRSSQNLPVAASPTDPDEVAVAWTHLDQVPNPFTYLPTGAELRFAVFDDGRWGPTHVAAVTPPDQLPVNGRLVRSAGGGYAAVYDAAAIKDLPGAQLGLTATSLPLFAVWSPDGSAWSAPRQIGTPDMVFAADPEGESDARMIAAKPDVAAGPSGQVAAVWAETDRDTVRLARSADGGRTWSAPEDTVGLAGPGLQPAVAYDGRGRLGIFFYDAHSDQVRDARWMVTPKLAVESRGVWSTISLDEPFDARAAEKCTYATGQRDPLTKACEEHASALGVQQDIEGLPKGFGVTYTVSAPLARDGRTDVRFARVK